jgi:hypothetical protein
MKHRKLRIAWSVVWGVVAVLLVALWARSYRDLHGLIISDERYFIDSQNRRCGVATNAGLISFCVTNPTPWPVSWSFSYFQEDQIRHGFGWWTSEHGTGLNDSSTAVVVPLWLPVAIAAGFTAFPWIRHASHFSLRTLLIATTFIAVGLGVIVWLR